MSTQHSVPSTQHSKARLRALGLRPRKRLSQSFLEDERVAAAIVRAARLTRETEVLEVGPGLGVLTRRLARAAKRVVAVELDTELAQQISEDNVTVVNADILKIRPQDYFEGPYTVVANLPYHITSPAIRHLLGAGPPFAQGLVVMVQAEVADRIAAKPGDMSAVAVAIQAQAHVSIIRRVPAAAFYPRPKVDSAVLRLEPLADTEREITRDEKNAFVEFVQSGFKQPRKTLANSLSEGLNIPKSAAKDLLNEADIEPTKRPEALAVGDWVRLFRCSIAHTPRST